MKQPEQSSDERNRQLMRIVEQMQDFIDTQMSRWEALADFAENAHSMHTQAARLLEEAKAEKANWATEHKEQVAKLQHESDLLEQAWKRVEVEDRRLAAMKSIAANTHKSAVQSHLSNTASTDRLAAERLEPELPDDSPTDRLVAVQEFVKLSVEIANHAKRTR